MADLMKVEGKRILFNDCDFIIDLQSKRRWNDNKGSATIYSLHEYMEDSEEDKYQDR
jgi:hypothetical protein